ncbi:MAG: malate synthase G, partial [Alphaproteobacteria bacterium]|nr:malate synthase G [Alphaproteobacteria bacterium]
MSDYQTKSGLSVHSLLVDFIEGEVLPGLSVTAEQFWAGFAGLVAVHAPTNARLLARRDALQGEIDDWHRKYGPVSNNPQGYEFFLKDIGYLVPEPGDF